MEGIGMNDDFNSIQSWIILCQMVRGIFIIGVTLTVLFGGEPSLLEAVIGWIERH